MNWSDSGIPSQVKLYTKRLSCLGVPFATPRSNNESWEEGSQTIQVVVVEVNVIGVVVTVVVEEVL